MKKIVAVVALATSLPAAAIADDSWQFALSPYLWFAGVKGDVATFPGAPTAPIDISPKDAIEDNEASYMVLFGAKKGRHGVLADFIYTDTRSDEELIPEIGLEMKSISKNTLISVAYAYEVYNREGASLDLFAGARYWDVDSTLRFSGGLGNLAGRRVENSESWIDPLLGVKGRTPLGQSAFYVAGWAEIGGFGVGSESFYQWSLNIGYQWNDAIGTTLGYREFDVDYDEDGFVYDIKQPGWTLGLTWRF